VVDLGRGGLGGGVGWGLSGGGGGDNSWTLWQKYSVQVDKPNRMYLIIFSSRGLQVFFL
jgi:hypothetical protein